MVVGAKVCDLTEDLLWFVCGLYVGFLTSPLPRIKDKSQISPAKKNERSPVARGGHSKQRLNSH